MSDTMRTTIERKFRELYQSESGATPSPVQVAVMIDALRDLMDVEKASNGGETIPAEQVEAWMREIVEAALMVEEHEAFVEEAADGDAKRRK